MWTLVEANLVSMHEIRTSLTMEDFARACLHLKRKGDAMKTAQQQAEGRALLRKSGLG